MKKSLAYVLVTSTDNDDDDDNYGNDSDEDFGVHEGEGNFVESYDNDFWVVFH